MNKENILITGGGGREHALGWKLRESPNSGNIFFTPNNAGTDQIGSHLPVDLADRSSLLKAIETHNIHRVVLGPEAHLAMGLTNILQKEGVLVTGPSKEAALLETDKAWAVKFMEEFNIPHPNTYIPTDYKSAIDMATYRNPREMVIKATGPARGKGVILPENKEEAKKFISDVYIKKIYGDDQKVIFQQRLSGKEISFMVLTDGIHVAPLLPAKDYKRIGENDTGKNTGGMGAYVPRIMNKSLWDEAMNKIIYPTIEGMRKKGTLFNGVLYAGLMVTGDGLKVIEYNARFGDPETQPLMMMLDGDLLEIFQTMDSGTLSKDIVTFREGSAVCVVLAAPGYPESPVYNQVIHGLDTINDSGVQIFHAGTQMNKEMVVVSGGRVLSVTAYGKTQEEARKKAYENAEKVKFEGKQIRRDIAAT